MRLISVIIERKWQSREVTKKESDGWHAYAELRHVEFPSLKLLFSKCRHATISENSKSYAVLVLQRYKSSRNSGGMPIKPFR